MEGEGKAQINEYKQIMSEISFLRARPNLAPPLSIIKGLRNSLRMCTMTVPYISSIKYQTVAQSRRYYLLPK